MHPIRFKDTVAAILGNGGVGKDINLGAGPAVNTGATGIGCTAGRVQMFTKAISGLRRTGKVRLTGIVGNIACLFDELVGTCGTGRC